MSRPLALLAWTVAALAAPALGCARAPSPLAPNVEGSIGLPHRGVLTRGEQLPRLSPAWGWLRNDDHHWGLPRFVASIERAAQAVVDRTGPGTPKLLVGDLSRRTGGILLPHLSHRSGRDADLLLYVTTLEGAPVVSPGWVHVEADGLAEDEKNHRFLRFDVRREWELVKALLTDPEAHLQWVFANHVLEALMIEWARASGEPDAIVAHAETVMLEPQPGGAHDDHLHVRTACTTLDLAGGCEPSGPSRPWLVPPFDPDTYLPEPDPRESDAALARSLFTELPGPPGANAPAAASASTR